MFEVGDKVNYIWISIRLVGGTLVSLICIRQTDLKSLIAYSSITHMGIVIGGLITLLYWGYCGSYTLMIAHGLCSSGLFCQANANDGLKENKFATVEFPTKNRKQFFIGRIDKLEADTCDMTV